jgi:hypothetical protein
MRSQVLLRNLGVLFATTAPLSSSSSSNFNSLSKSTVSQQQIGLTFVFAKLALLCGQAINGKFACCGFSSTNMWRPNGFREDLKRHSAPLPHQYSVRSTIGHRIVVGSAMHLWKQYMCRRESTIKSRSRRRYIGPSYLMKAPRERSRIG